MEGRSSEARGTVLSTASENIDRFLGLKPSEVVKVLRAEGIYTYESWGVIRVLLDSGNFALDQRMRIVAKKRINDGTA